MQTVLLVRRDTPAFGRAVPEGRADLGRVRVVEIRRGREDDLQPCDRAVSRYPELVKPYGQRGEVLSEVPSDRETLRGETLLPPGYRIEKKGPYYRLRDPDGVQIHEKALHAKKMERLIEDTINAMGTHDGSMG